MLENVKNILGKYLETNYKDSNIQLNDFSFNESMDPNLEEVEAVECTNLHDHKILIYEDDNVNIKYHVRGTMLPVDRKSVV